MFFWCHGRKRVIFWQDAQNSLNFKANDDELKFDNKGNLGHANDNYSGGLFVLGLCLERSQGALPASQHPANFLDMSLQHQIFFIIQDF